MLGLERRTDMEGQVFVPYTGIGGFNMDVGIMPMSLYGSTTPGVIEDNDGTTVNAVWVFPGGIVNKAPGGYGWGYAVRTDTLCTDEEIKQWLKGELTSDRGSDMVPSTIYADEDITAELPTIADDINKLIKRYVHDILEKGDYNRFRDNYSGCVVMGSK